MIITDLKVRSEHLLPYQQIVLPSRKQELSLEVTVPFFTSVPVLLLGVTQILMPKSGKNRRGTTCHGV